MLNSVIFAGGVYRWREVVNTSEELRERILRGLAERQCVESVMLNGALLTPSEVAEFVEEVIAAAPRPLPLHLITGLWRFLPALANLRIRDDAFAPMRSEWVGAEQADG